MKNFIKDNIVLVLGVSLPLLLVVVFMLAGALPKYLVADPQYDFLFSDDTGSYVQFEVRQQKLYMKADLARYEDEKSLPHLYRYEAATGKVQEIAFHAPGLSGQAQDRVPVTEAAGLTISSAPAAPDGYRFFNGGFGYDAGGLMFGSRRNSGPVLGKSGRNIPISYNGSGEQYQPSTFIGWIIP